MSVQDIIRAWKSDEDDKDGKQDEKNKNDEQVPPTPAGPTELSDDELAKVSSGGGYTAGAPCIQNPNATDESDALFGKR